jgi:flagellar protein FliO/FliZ
MAFLQSLFSGQNPALTLVWVFLGLAAILIASFWLFRKIAGARALKPTRSRAPRLAVTDAAIVDDKRRLVLVRRDNVEHLVMIGGPADIVIEQNIQRAQPVAAPREAAPAYREAVIAAEAPPPARPVNGELAGARPRARTANGRGKAGQDYDFDEAETMAAEAEQAPAESAASPAKGAVSSIIAAARRGRAEPPVQRTATQTQATASQKPTAVAVQAAPATAAAAAAAAPDFEFDLASELERDTASAASAAIAKIDQSPPVQAAISFEDELSAEMAQDFDLPRQINDNSHGSYAAGPASSNPRARPDEDVDDEMQRLLKELANA